MARRDRLVPQGLRAARAPTPRWPGRCASSRSTTAREVWLNGTPMGENTGAYIPFEMVAEALKRNGHEPARGARRLAPLDHRLPARRPEHRRRARPAAGGTTRASSARSTCASSTRSTSRRCRCGPVIDCGDLRGERADARSTCKNVTARGAAGRRSPASSATDKLDLGTKTRRPRRDRRVHRHAAHRQAAAVVAAGPEPLRRQLHRPRRRQEGRRLLAAQRDPLDQGLQRAPAASTAST